MTCRALKINNYIEEIEEHFDAFKQQLNEEKKELEDSTQKVTSLTNSFCRKENYENAEVTVPMKISLPEKSSLLDGYFKEDTEIAFLHNDDREEKRIRLALERKAEYNAYLARKEKELFAKRRLPVDQSMVVPPKSVLESVDYETILAKRKEEELKFRQLNYADHLLNEDLNKTQVKLPVSQTVSPRSNDYERPNSSKDLHFLRTGGGGEPVKDSYGNIIATRGFKESLPLLPLPSFKQDFTSFKKDTYREELARQIEEKKRLEALAKLKALEEEEKAAQRLEQQRRQMLLEYQTDLIDKNKKKEQQQQERLRRLEEFQRKEAALKQKIRENKLNEAKPAVLVESTNTFTEIRSTSPPVPAFRSKAILKKVASPILSPVHINTEVAVPGKTDNVFVSLAEIRRKIMQDQQNLNRITKRSYEVMNRRTVPDVLADEEEDNEFQGLSEQLEDLKT